LLPPPVARGWPLCLDFNRRVAPRHPLLRNGAGHQVINGYAPRFLNGPAGFPDVAGDAIERAEPIGAPGRHSFALKGCA
jgi:hypothetical protein